MKQQIVIGKCQLHWSGHAIQITKDEVAMCGAVEMVVLLPATQTSVGLCDCSHNDTNSSKAVCDAAKIAVPARASFCQDVFGASKRAFAGCEDMPVSVPSNQWLYR